MADYVTVCSISELPPGRREVFEINSRWVAVFNIDGKFYAIEDLCTHDEGPLAEGEIEGHEIKCPRHGAKFDLRSGKVLTAPALVDVPWYEVRIQDDAVQVKIK